MATNTAHWHVLQELTASDHSWLDTVRSFMVIGYNGEGVLFVNDDGRPYWHGEFQYGWKNVHVLQSTGATPLSDSLTGVVEMAHGWNHVVMRTERGQLLALGMNDEGQLGQNPIDTLRHFTPIPIQCPSRFVSVRCGFDHNLALTDQGKVWAWGGNYSGQIAIPSSVDTHPFPHLVDQLTEHRVVAIACGGQHSLVLTDYGQVYAWGCNEYRQLGHENHEPNWNCSTPTRMDIAWPVRRVAAGDNHSLLLTETGQVYGCGGNECGQLAQPIATTKLSARLTRIVGLPSSIADIGAHFAAPLSIAITTDRICYVWGELRTAKIQEIPLKLSPIYSTIESPLSVYARYQNNPYSVEVTPIIDHSSPLIEDKLL